MGLKGKSRTFCPQIADTPSLDLASLLVKERGWSAADAARRLKAKLHSETPEVKPEGHARKEGLQHTDGRGSGLNLPPKDTKDSDLEMET